MIYLPFLAGLVTLTGTQAVFTPANGNALKAAVGTCTLSWNGVTMESICTSGCLGENATGFCPIFAASNVPGTSNSYGVIGEWNVSVVDDMSRMFQGSEAFNGDLSKWDTGKVESMRNMFKQSEAFNSDISKWDTGAVTDMEFMFNFAKAFNNDISKWDTGAVTDMGFMFHGAAAFNGDISKWNTVKVTKMRQMFFQAATFNSDLSKWNTESVTDMYNMFYASGFKRTLCGGAWESLSSDSYLTDSYLTSTGRLGCCPAGSYMSNPMSNPFLEANSCSPCPAGTMAMSENDETQCTACASGTYSIGGATSCPYSVNTCPVGTYANGTAACLLSCSSEGNFECTDNQWQQIKAFYSERCPT